MARIKYFKSCCIAIYIYGEKYNKHHEKHILVLKADEECQYGFNGKPLSCSKALKNRKERIMLKNWILAHQEDLEKAWEDVNNGRKPSIIPDKEGEYE